MFFGKQERFAIECEIYARGGSGQVLATMCFYAGGHRIGDKEQGTVLYGPASFFDLFLNIPTPRKLPGQETKSDTELLADAESILYGDRTLSQEESAALTSLYEPCTLCPTGGESFDGEFVLLLEEGQGERLVWRDYETKQTVCLKLEKGECEAILTEFVTWASAEISATGGFPD